VTAGGDRPFFDVVLGQRACRSFAPDPIDDELVARVLTAATHAPSAENRQPWVFVVVRDPDMRRSVAEVTRQAWHGGARAFSEGRLAPGRLADVERGVERGIEEAPVLVVVCGDEQRALAVTLSSSVYPAAQNLCLAANALGLGSAFTTLATVDPVALRPVLGLPDHVRPMAVVPLGRPAKPLGPPRRAPVGDKAHRDRYGTPW
jgi:nitroreductase